MHTSSLEELTAVLERTENVLLDFDGPVADLFPSGSGTKIADETRTPILRAGVVIPEPLASTVEHLVVLEFAAEHAPEALESAEQAAVAGEIASARTAPVTPGAGDFLSACAAAGRRVGIISNNAAPAIEGFLELHGLRDQVEFILGRPFARPRLMKPDPTLAFEALRALRSRPDQCCMVGDAVTDIEFARHAGVRSVGYAKNAERGRQLAAAGADAITPTMSDLAAAVRLLGRG
ncbi:HAD-IA family hydrolase [Kribbella alba]|uniref:HAD family hydrolase n=1 Tax=Kribbella alba TaxID=190197 RepID=UPI0031E113D3